MRVLYSKDIDGASGDVSFVKIAGLSSETKPTANVSTGSEFFEVDTDKKYIFDEATLTWTAISSSSGSGSDVDLSGKADKTDTVLNTTLSHGRMANSTVGDDSIAYGSWVTASGSQSQAVGNGTSASGSQAHAEGNGAIASGNCSHAEGATTTASGTSSHSEGSATTASGGMSHAEGMGTIANHKAQHAGGEYNVADPSEAAATERGTYAEIIGNGTSAISRSNIRVLDWSGNERIKGELYVGCNNDSSGGTKVATLNDIPDVQINGTSILNQGVANVPLASVNDFGVVKVGTGLQIVNSKLYVMSASSANIKDAVESFRPIVPVKQHESVFYGLATAAGDATQSSSSNTVGTYTEDAKSAISQMLDAPETVSGTTPSITGKAGVRYICGEVSTISITPPASGTIDVVFESGSTPAVMTVPSTVKFPVWFDAENLEANKTYEINILDGVYGVVTSWA